ncbi:hypothetical protein HK097_011672 [Rhizophlyctis rosea]|uniref:Major facilitator superfamily (MFS) profile domain-containing protein n=1 Tax=Rhizophlyctis rosea TaxID=64517 RepID=A0AAD5X751_9FUNG|nr:hypothetical protein HK097_011672 [Rhizophlyctis rosea]
MKLFAVLTAFGAAVGGFLFGYEIGVVSQVLSMDAFGLRFGLKINERGADGELLAATGAADATGWITFTFLIGCVAGAAIVSDFADRFGRKRSLLIGAAIFVIGVIFQAAASNFGLLYAGRLISGVGVGVSSQVVPLYISETAATNVRGRLISVYQLMITVGIFIAACVNSGIIASSLSGSETEWRLALAIQAIPGVLIILINSFLPFSPRWLAGKHRDDEAIAALSKLRSADPNSEEVQTEYNQIREEVKLQESIGEATWAEVGQRKWLKRVMIGIILQFFQQWTGINVILYYQNELITKMGFDPADAKTAFNLAINAINMVATLPGMYLIERMGRRKLLLFGALGMGIAQYIVTIALREAEVKSQPGLAWLAIVAVFVFEIFFASTWGPVVWVYQSEIYPLRLRSKATGLATISNWANGAIIAKVAPLINEKAGNFTYLLWGSMALASFVYTFFFIPETMGKSLEEMDMIFDGSVASASPSNIDTIDVEGNPEMTHRRKH